MTNRVCRRLALRLLVGAPAALLLSACSGKAAQPATVVSSSTSTGTSAAPPTAVAVATATATPLPETPTPAATPADATPTSVATALPTAVPSTPTPGATPAAVIAAALNAQNPGRQWNFALRPLLFQVDNAPDARPQSGLNSAYVVYETLAEGGITRFTALFVQQALSDIGNLRSARLVDLDLVPQWDGVLLHVGASTPVEQMIAAAGIAQLDFDQTNNTPASFRTSDRVAPYNLYTSLARLRPYLTARGIAQTATSPRAFPVGPLPAGVTSTAGQSLTIPYGAPSTAGYTWDAGAKGYRRSTDGTTVIDANTGEPVIVSNVVAQFAKEIVTDIIEDVEGSHSLQFVQTGAGKAVLLRDQRRIDLTWRRDRKDQLTAFAFPDGSPATFAPGNVWISFVPDSMQLA